VIYKITYQGEIVSSNAFYSSKHWSFRSAAKNKFKEIFTILLLQARVKKFSEFSLELEYRSKHDVDNVGIMAKFFADTLKDKYVVDDTPKYFKSLKITYNPSLAKNTIQFLIDAKE
jgi:hypothetical protein